MKEFDINKSESATGSDYVTFDRQDYCGSWRRCAANFLDGMILGMAYKLVNAILLIIASPTGTAYLVSVRELTIRVSGDNGRLPLPQCWKRRMVNGKL